MVRLLNYDQITQLPPLLLNYDYYYNYNLLITKISGFTIISLYYKYCNPTSSFNTGTVGTEHFSSLKHCI